MFNLVNGGTTITTKEIYEENVNEIWKPIKGYEGLYEVSNMGRVKRLTTIKHNRLFKEMIYQPRIITGGYVLVRLSKDDIHKDYYVHRLVAQHFVDNPFNFNEINHINEDKTDNRAINLEFCNRYYNNNYGTRRQRVAQALKKPISQYNLDGELIKSWDSATDASRELNICKSGIYACLKGRQKTSFKCLWRYNYTIAA